MFKKIIKSALILLSGILGGQVFVVASSPILTRLFSPEDFGAFGVYAATLYLIISISSFRYEVSIPLVAEERDAANLAIASIFIVIVFTFSLFLVVYVAGSFLFPRYADIFQWALPVGVMTAGIYNILINYSLRIGAHVKIAKTGLLQSFAGVVTQLGAGLLSMGLIGLILGQIVGISSGIAGLSQGAVRRRLTKYFDIRDAFRVLIEQKNFAKYDAPSAFIAVANNHAPTLLVGILFSPVAAGLFFLVQRVVVIPFGIISGAVSSSLLSHGREHNLNSQLYFLKKAISSLKVIIPTATVGALAAKYGFSWVFGEQWSGGGAVAAWMILYSGQKFVFDSISPILAMQAKQKLGLQMQFSLLFFRCAVLILVGILFGFQYGVIAFSIVSALSYFISALLILSNIDGRSGINITLSVLDVVLPYIVIAAFSAYFLSQIWLTIVVLIYIAWTCFRIISFILINFPKK